MTTTSDDAYVDHVTVRTLQATVGTRLQDEFTRRRLAGEPTLAPADEHQLTRHLAAQVVDRHFAEQAELGRPAATWQARQRLLDDLHARLFGAGSLERLLEDESVENIDINGFDNVFVQYADGRVERHRPLHTSNDELVEDVQTLAAHVGLTSRAFDAANHEVTLRLPDGSRLHAVQAVTPQPMVSIRRHRLLHADLDSLVAGGTMSVELGTYLRDAVRARRNMMISGATNAGKTTLLRALVGEIDPAERLLTVERSLELGVHELSDLHPNAGAFEERLPNAEGVGGVSMARNLRSTLRMNPSRVIVGEVLGDEVVTMLNAMSQGNDGSLSTIHSNDAEGVVSKIAAYAIQAPERLPWDATELLVANALDLIVHVERLATPEGHRRVVSSVVEITGYDRETGLQRSLLWHRPPGELEAQRTAAWEHRAWEAWV